MKFSTSSIVVDDGIRLHKQHCSISHFLLLSLQVGQVGPPPEITLQACPAAVAASRDLFLSASAGDLSVGTRNGTPLDAYRLLSPARIILDNRFDLREFQALKWDETGSDRDPGHRHRP